MSVALNNYKPSDPAKQLRRIQELLNAEINCPVCGRVAKWDYYYHKVTSKKDRTWRCTLHAMSPIPGPAYEPDEEKVHQLY